MGDIKLTDEGCQIMSFAMKALRYLRWARVTFVGSLWYILSWNL